ncbi:hypothetical protein BC941DRAFT_422792 [Chlamydoabsidia padenii]|nr:hypothetical protein BC941DRAFT_422792 [Chlamydoabsidia padenii]
MTLYDKLLHALTHYSLDELGVLPCAPDLGTIPLDTQCYFPLVVVDGKLGIAFDDLATILQDTQERFIQHKKQQQEAGPTFEQLTRIMVLLKPEHYTAMNARKELVLSGQVSLQQELKLLELIFTIPRNTKCSIAWHHRQWLFKQNMELIQLDSELQLCQRAITLYPRNYYAWNHRHWLLDLMVNSNERLEQEYQHACQWIENNVSDHTGIRYLEEVVKILNNNQTYSLHDLHLEWLDALILRYPGHESLWCHRRYCAILFPYVKHDQQHKFIQSIMTDQHNSSSDTQKLLAAKFGLWLCHLDMNQESRQDPSLVDTYLEQVQKMETTPIYLHHWKQHFGPYVAG